ncbi:PREDICTED: uncharacterized protein LOC108769505 [Trachymyrmex cornetzi]|uniref:uncharacterized protein LOC108769505 n=1 Tax=Trachymyrmex cornetzi TaxID=471704 RepID=UPI00084F24B5|nr:PREDICTED: uncharacterized protein LOC108769505 [Trachymyrmex cornetzi]
MSIEKRKLVEELHASERRNFPRRRVVVHDRDDLWQAHVGEMRPYARFSKGYNYILTVIDVLSKYAWPITLKSKSRSDVTAALSRIFREDERYPRNLQTDQEKEFYNTTVQKKIVKKYNIVTSELACLSRLLCFETRHKSRGTRTRSGGARGEALASTEMTFS